VGWQDYRSIESIARESFLLAKSQVYDKARPRIQVIGTFVELQPRDCPTEAPKSIREIRVDGPRSYGENALDTVRMQLYKAGIRLAAMLNGIYT
jgi:hypothetical protein